MSRCQIAELPGPDRGANQPQSRVSDRGRHMPHLMVFALAQADFQPRRRDRFSFAYRRVAWPKPRRFGDDARSGRQIGGLAIADARCERRQRFGLRYAFNLRPVGFLGFLARVAQAVLQFAIIG